MVSEWPIRPAGRAAAVSPPRGPRPVADAVHRLDDRIADLFLPPEHRLGDRVRALVSAMLDGLVVAIERDMRGPLAQAFGDRAELAASLASPSVGIAAPVLGDARTLRHPPLVALLLRRAGSVVLADRIAPGAGDGAGLPSRDADPRVAAAAVAFMIAAARRRDAFGEATLLLLDDLPAEIAHWLVWHVAAALGHYLRVHHQVGDDEADARVSETARRVLAGHDEGRGIDAAAARLASSLATQGRIEGPLLAALLGSGQVGVFTAALASATGLPVDEVWTVLGDPADGRLATLLRGAGVERDAAAAVLLAAIGDGHDPADEIAMFDACTDEEAARAIERLGLAFDYRDASRRIDAALAHAEGVR